MYTKGEKIIDLKEGLYKYSGKIPNFGSYLSLIDMQLIIMKIDRMAKKLSRQDPKSCPLGYKWDSITLQNWIDSNGYSLKMKLCLEGTMRVILGVELSEVSLLYFLYYVKQSGSF